MGNDGRQRIDLATDTAEVTSRPLLSGVNYRLVLPLRRVFLAAWDKATYGPGGRARLKIGGRHLGHEPCALVIEREEPVPTAPGVAPTSGWLEVARCEAPIGADGTSAEAAFAFPDERPPCQTVGRLTAARFGGALAAGVEGRLEVTAEALDGHGVRFVIEREVEGGGWEEVASSAAKLEGGACSAPFTPPAPGPAREPPGSCAFAAKAFDGGLAWMEARLPGPDGAELQFVLEREEAPGVFREAGSAVARLRGGSARASATLAGGGR